MKFVIEATSFALLIPAGLSFAIAFVWLRAFPGEPVRRWAAAAGCAAGFWAAYALLETRHLRPATHWHWLPWIGMVAAAAGPLRMVARMPAAITAMLWVTVAIGSAWLLVPTWSDLNPTRGAYVSITAGGVLLLAVWLDRLAARNPGLWVSLSLCVAAASGAVLLAVFVSLRFGLLALAATASLTGTQIHSFRDRTQDWTRGTFLFYATIVGGLMLAGQLNSALPPACFALIALAPLALWLCECPPLSRARGQWGVMIRLVAVGLPLAAALLLASGVSSAP